MSRDFHKFWLKITAIVIGSFGPVFFLGTMASTLEPARLTLDLLSWPIDGATTYASADTRFLSALTGAEPETPPLPHETSATRARAVRSRRASKVEAWITEFPVGVVARPGRHARDLILLKAPLSKLRK